MPAHQQKEKSFVGGPRHGLCADKLLKKTRPPRAKQDAYSREVRRLKALASRKGWVVN